MSVPPSFPNVPPQGAPPQSTGVVRMPTVSFPTPGAPLSHTPIPLPPFVPPPGAPTSYAFPPPIPPMMVPPVAGLVPPAIPVPMPTATVPKSTDVYIGKIPNSVDDDTIKKLLEVCGEVKSWKRAEDPDTHQPKGFGFCEFDEAEGVLRATRLLNSLKVDGQELQARSSSATAKYVEAFQQEKAIRGPEDTEEGEHVDTEEQKDAKLMDAIEKILNEREEAKQKGKEETTTVKDHTSEVGSHRSQDPEAMTKDRYSQRYRHSPDLRSGRALSRERREIETIIRDEETAYRKRLQEWEGYERKIEKELQRESDIQRELHRERMRLRRIDLEEDSDDNRDPWARKPYKNSRRAETRRRRRRDEEAWDIADKAKEQKEQEMKRQKAQEEEEMELDQSSPRQPDAEAAAGEEKKLNGVEEGTTQKETKPEHQPGVLPGSSSIALTLQAKKQPKPAPPAPSPLEANALKDIFGDDEEEKPRREARGLAFSEIDTRPKPEGKDAAKNLIDTLPKTKEEIYSYSIKWEAYKSDVVGAKIKSWLNKKVSEILGFEEASLTSFIMAQLEQHQTPGELEKELAEVLDDEQQTETFIIKLYRTVIYETEKAAANQP